MTAESHIPSQHQGVLGGFLTLPLCLASVQSFQSEAVAVWPPRAEKSWWKIGTSSPFFMIFMGKIIDPVAKIEEFVKCDPGFFRVSADWSFT